MLLSTTIVATAIVLFLMWYRFKVERLELIAKSWISFSYRIEQIGKYIIPSKLNNYKKERTLLVKESLDNE